MNANACARACAQELDRTCSKVGGIRFGVWVNVSLKGFRMKAVEFTAAGMSTDVPRPLSSASVAVRNIFFPYSCVGNAGTSSANVERGVDALGPVASDDDAGITAGTAGSTSGDIAIKKVRAPTRNIFDPAAVPSSQAIQSRIASRQTARSFG